MFKLVYSTAIQLFIGKYDRQIDQEKEGFYCVIYIKFGNPNAPFYYLLENKSQPDQCPDRTENQPKHPLFTLNVHFLTFLRHTASFSKVITS